MDAQSTIKNRLEKNYKHRLKWAKNESLTAYRLYDRDIPEFPYIVDIYGTNAVVYEKTDKVIDENKLHHFDFLLEALKEITQIPEEEMFFKSRFKNTEKKYDKLSDEQKEIKITEGPLNFIVNLSDYLDTGLFLDHRPLRKILLNQKASKILNLFCYTGSLSVAAAYLKENSVTSVDMNKNYMEWAKRNFEANHIALNKHNFIVDNVINFLEKTEQKFDLILLDPPTFSNSKKMQDDFEIERDQEWIIDRCMENLTPDGTLYFSNNKRKFKLLESIKSKYSVKDITERTIPIDFHDKKIHQTYIIKHHLNL